MNRVTQLFLVAALAALLSPAVASSAPRMYIGFHDDVAFRWNPNRAEVLGQARSANATIVRTLVDWSKTAPTRPTNAANPVRPGVSVLGHRRARPQRTAAGSRGDHHDLGHAQVGERRQDAQQRPPERQRPEEFLAGRRGPLLRPVRPVPVGRALLGLERVEPAALPLAAVRRQGPLGRAAPLREDVRRRVRRAQGRQLAREGRDRRDLVARPGQEAERQLGHALARAASPSSSPPPTRGSSSTRGRTTRIRRR